MRKITASAALAAALAITGTAHADDYSGHWQVKVLATAVLPSGSLDVASVSDPHGLTGANAPLNGLATTSASTNVTPTIAVEYFFKPNVSVETIAGITSHHVFSPSLDGAGLVDHAQVIPFTVTAKYHLVGLLPYGSKP